MLTYTSGFTWIPLYVGLLYLVIKNNETMLQILWAVLCFAICIFISDLLADGIVKPLVHRYRPCSDPSIKYIVDIANGYRSSDPERRILNTEKIRSRTDWTPIITLDKGLDMCVASIEK